MGPSAVLLVIACCASLCLPLAAAERHDASKCQTLDQCIQLLTTYKLKPVGRDNVNDKPLVPIANKLKSFDGKAVEALIVLLSNKDSRVRHRAAFALAEFGHIDDKYLDALIAAQRRGGEWLAPAIASTGSQRAFDYLYSDFLKRPGEGSGDVLESFGAKAVKALVPLLDCKKGCNEQLIVTAFYVLSDMRDLLPPEAPSLVAIAKDGGVVVEARYDAQLLLISIKHPEGLKFLLQSLDDPGPLADVTIDQIAWYGDDGRSAGPKLLQMFLDDRWVVLRPYLAFALGRIGYSDAKEALSKAVTPKDWLLTYNIVESLAELGAHEYLGQLETIARTYWSVPVRHNAQRAVNYLKTGRFSRPADVQRALTESPRRRADQLFRDDNMRCGHAPVLWNGKEVFPSGQLELRPDQADYYRKYIGGLRDDRPISAVLPVRQGWLVGTDNGEWGGALWFVRKGDEQRLVNDNVAAIVPLGSRVYVLTGLAHMGFNQGWLWKIDTKAGVKAVRVARLPGEPVGVRTLNDDTMIIESVGEPVIFHKGRLQTAECKQ